MVDRTASTEPVTVGPLREVLALPSFRRFLAAQFLSALVNGTLRFVLVWLTLELTDWKPAIGLVGVALGLSALMVALPAGAISDRLDRKPLFIRLSAVTTVVLLLATVLVAEDRATVPLVAVLAAVLGGLLAAVAPTVQAMVPALVPPQRLMNGVALQMISMNVAMMTGALAGGAAIAVGGVAGGLGLLAVLEGVATAQMVGVRFPAAREPVRREPARLWADIADGMRWAAHHEPVRSLLGVMLAIGFMWSGVQLLLPDLAREELGQRAFASSVLFVPAWPGDARHLVAAGQPAHRGAARSATGVRVHPQRRTTGGADCSVALLRSHARPHGGGIVMTLQRTLLQQHTPDHLMGRSMGVNTLGLLGSFPLAAAVTSGLTAIVGTGWALACMGGATTVAAAAITLRRPLLDA